MLTIFPEVFPGVLDTSIPRIARERGRLDVRLHDLRDFTVDRHRSVDDRPFGGGPGMVFKPEPVFRAVEWIEARRSSPILRVLLTPQGEPFRQGTAERLAREEALLLICGHYEGFDERIRIGLRPFELSIGDYVLSGGELPALVVIDALARLQDGVLGDERSSVEDSFSRGLLDYPHYTRPVEFRGMRVPDVLRSGDHEQIAAWREMRARERTRARRKDLSRHVAPRWYDAPRPQAETGDCPGHLSGSDAPGSRRSPGNSRGRRRKPENESRDDHHP